MNTPSAWQADWQARLYEAVQNLGYSTITDLLRSRPAATWSQVVQELESSSSSRFAPVQVHTIFRAESTTPAALNYYIKSCLIRRIREAIPQGWAVGADFRFKLVTAFAHWSACLPQEYKEQCRKTFHELESKQMEYGWLPSEPDDPIILEVLTKSGFDLR
jgi:hypothetical protein